MQKWHVNFYIRLITPNGEAFERSIENHHLREPQTLRQCKSLLGKWQKANPGVTIVAAYRQYVDLEEV